MKSRAGLLVAMHVHFSNTHKLNMLYIREGVRLRVAPSRITPDTQTNHIYIYRERETGDGIHNASFFAISKYFHICGVTV